MTVTDAGTVGAINKAGVAMIAASFAGEGLINWLVILIMCFCAVLARSAFIKEPIETFRAALFALFYAVAVSMLANIAVNNIGAEYQLHVLFVALLFSLYPKKMISFAMSWMPK